MTHSVLHAGHGSPGDGWGGGGGDRMTQSMVNPGHGSPREGGGGGSWQGDTLTATCLPWITRRGGGAG